MKLIAPVKPVSRVRLLLNIISSIVAAINSSAERPITHKLFRFTRVALLTLSVGINCAEASTKNICDQAIQRAAAETGVPVSVLWSITRTETGRVKNGELLPWPWAVNIEGKGLWFDTKSEAQAYVLKNLNRGIHNFDVGCFQINYRWHGAAFRSIDQMFDPLENARYAAAFLLRLYNETGDWSVAAGTYHSRTSVYAKRYRARFDRIRATHRKTTRSAQLMTEQSPIIERNTAVPHKHNGFPLLTHTGSQQSIGSLVPLSQNQGTPLFQIPNIAEGS